MRVIVPPGGKAQLPPAAPDVAVAYAHRHVHEGKIPKGLSGGNILAAKKHGVPGHTLSNLSLHATNLPMVSKNASSGDLRIRRTRKLLWESCLELMACHAWDAIAVSDICSRALVHRTTFYKHFESKDDLLEQGFTELLFTSFPRAGHPFTQPAPDPRLLVHLFLDHVEKYRPLYRHVLSRDSRNSLTYTFRGMLADLIMDRLAAGMASRGQGIPDGAPQLELLANFQAGALLSLLAWWFEQRPDISRTSLEDHISWLMEMQPGRPEPALPPPESLRP